MPAALAGMHDKLFAPPPFFNNANCLGLGTALGRLPLWVFQGILLAPPSNYPCTFPNRGMVLCPLQIFQQRTWTQPFTRCVLITDEVEVNLGIGMYKYIVSAVLTGYQVPWRNPLNVILSLTRAWVTVPQPFLYTPLTTKEFPRSILLHIHVEKNGLMMQIRMPVN